MARTPAEERVYTLLKAAAAVTAIVSDRIYPVVAKQAAAMPQIVYKRISTDRINTLAGESGLEFCRLQVDCMADTYLAAKALAHAVLDAMDAATTVGSYTEGQQDLYQSDPELFIVSLDFDVANGEE